MNFEDESYVRLYVRDTKTWLRLGFAGQCCLMFLLRKLDRAGVLDGIEDLCPDVALITGVPDSIVEIGMPRLLERGVFELRGNCLVMPNFIEAQTAIRTDKARQKDSRDRRLAEARLVTIRDGADGSRDADVTPRDETVTANDTAKQPVTLYSAVPNQAKPSCAEKDTSPKAPSVGVQAVFDHYRGTLGHPRHKLDPKRIKLIEARLKDYSVDDLKVAIIGCSKSDFHMGRHPNYPGQRHDSLELILRDAAHVDKFIELGFMKASPITPVSRAGPFTSKRDETMQFLADEHRAALEREAAEAS